MIIRELITRLGLKVDTNAFNRFNDRLKESKKRLEGLRTVFGGIRNVGLGLTAGVTFPLTMLGKSAIQTAGDFLELENKFTQVFGNVAKEADKFAENLGDKVGRSTKEIKEGFTSFQQQAIGLGLTNEAALDLSKSMVSLAIDFGSFNNLSDQESIQRFISGLSGSSEVFDRFGINLKQAAIEQELLNMGMGKFSDASELQKFQARASIIERTMGRAGAIGDAERTLGSFSNQQRATMAEITDSLIAIGNILMPIAQDVFKIIQEWLKSFQELSPETKKLIVKIGLILAAIGPIVTIVGQLGLAFIGVSAIVGALPVKIAAMLTPMRIFAALSKSAFLHWAIIVTSIQYIIENWDKIKRLPGVLMGENSANEEAARQWVAENAAFQAQRAGTTNNVENKVDVRVTVDSNGDAKEVANQTAISIEKKLKRMYYKEGQNFVYLPK